MLDLIHIQLKIKQDDTKALEKLYGSWFEPLYKFSLKMVKSPDVAEELVQEFFVDIWKKRADNNIKLSFKSYMFQSVKNKSLKYLRHLEVRKKHLEYAQSNTNSSSDISPESIFEAKELQTLVNNVIHQLPERARTAFTLNRFEGKTYQEIADILQVSVKTIEADMGKALKTFRNELMKNQYPVAQKTYYKS